MAILDDSGERMTPTEAAKEILLGNAQNAGYWSEQHYVNWEKLTESEKQRIDAALKKQFDRLQKLFGFSGWRLG